MGFIVYLSCFFYSSILNTYRCCYPWKYEWWSKIYWDHVSIWQLETVGYGDWTLRKQVRQDAEVTIQDDGSFSRELCIIILRTWSLLFKTSSNNPNHLKLAVDNLHIKAVLNWIIKNLTCNLYTKAPLMLHTTGFMLN